MNIHFILILITLLESLQFLIIAATISNFIPQPLSVFAQKLFPLSMYDVHPEREMLLYRAWVIAAIAIHAVLLYAYRKRYSDGTLARPLLTFAITVGIGIFLQVFAAFKMVLLGQAWWLFMILGCGMAVSLGATIFWPELEKLMTRAYAYIGKGGMSRHAWLGDCAIIAVLLLLLMPSNLENVTARIFTQDQFYHFDGTMTGAAWAHASGCVLNQDVISQYGIVMPIVVAEILTHTVGFDYPGAVGIIVYGTILYYLGLYIFLRVWLKSRALSAFGIFLTAKLHLFHWGVTPLIWQFLSVTALRFWADPIFFLCVWRHAQTKDRRWLWAASVIAGIVLAWTIDVGIYMLLAWMSYVFIAEFLRHRDEKPSTSPLHAIICGVLQALLALGTALFVAMLITWALQGPTLWRADFWEHVFVHAALFLKGWGAMPVTEGLKDKQFFAFLMGFAIPMVYLFTLMFVGALILLRRIHSRHVMAVMFCIYGLGQYHYFINRSGVTSYYAVCIPLVMVICFWVDLMLRRVNYAQGRIIKCVLAAAAFGALSTSYLLMYYPNVLNLGGLDWAKERAYYREHYHFPEDTALITRLTAPNEPVALISSFEVKMLVDAKRRPFFYYFPLIESSLMDTDRLRGTYLHTYARIDETIAHLERARPPYVFVENKLWKGRDQISLGRVLKYVEENYTPGEKGKYLTAYRRKN